MKDPTDPKSLHMQAVELGGGMNTGDSERAVAARISETAGEMLQVAARLGSPVESIAALLVALSALQRIVELEGFDGAKAFAAAEEIALTIKFEVERAGASPRYFILDGHTPVACNNIRKWGDWMESDSRKVAEWSDPDRLFTLEEPVRVSTVFLGIDHGFLNGAPVLFETMVFGGPLDQEQWRYCTWDEAEAGHTEMVERVKRAAQESK